MRIKRLELKAFGPFTDRTIEFVSRQPGLHIIYGPNEAGKSSSLRALKALLYGFPERTTDNFQHANNQLLVGGVLEGMEGQELTFYRRKRRIADLLDPNGNPIAPDTLATFLHGIELTLFESLYGIDHKTLIAGGEDILAQKGKLGQALFSAGTGISSLKKIMDSLETEANELYKDRGSKQQINQAVREYQDLKKSVREAWVLPSTWKEHQRRLQDAEAELAKLEEESRQKSAEVQRLNRLHKAIPELAELENLQKQLLDLGDVVLLPPDFSEKLQEIEQGFRESTLEIEKDKDRLKKLHEKEAGISLNLSFLDHSKVIEDLHQRVDRYRNNQNDRIKLDGMRIAYRRDAGSLIETVRAGLTLKDAASLRSVLNKKGTIQRLSVQHEAINQKVSQARKQKEEAEKELRDISEALSCQPAVRENDGLIKAIKLARNVGDIDEQIKEISREIAFGKKNCQVELKRIGVWSGGLDELLELPLPLPETIRSFESACDELDKERQQLKIEREKAQEELEAARIDSKEILYGGEVPSERDLVDIREKRQVGWQLLRRQWIDGNDISREAAEYAPGQEMPEAYEKNVERADFVADRLRREAERVTKAASLRARIESLEEAIQGIVKKLDNQKARQSSLDVDWHEKWEVAGIKPLSPKEMLAWLTDIDKIRFRITEILKKENEESDKNKSLQKYCNTLVEAMKALGENEEFPSPELAPILVYAESVSEDITRQKVKSEKFIDKRVAAVKSLEKAQREHEEADNAMIQWQRDWNKALSVLGLKEQVSPGEAIDIIETLSICFDKLEKAKDFQSRIDGIERDVKTFRDDVETLLTKTAPDLKELPSDLAVLQLYALFTKAQKDNEILKKNNEEIEALVVDIENADKRVHSLDERMADLLATAQCEKASDLAESIRKSREYQRLHEKISEAYSSLAKVSEGISPEEIKFQAGQVDVDTIPGQVSSLLRQIEEELYPRISASLKLIGEETKELQLMDGSGQAAEAAEKMEQVAARIQHLLDQYTRIRLATKVLKDEIERYREEHQDPVLQIASRLFFELTLGSFAGLRADIDDTGNPILVGIRPDGSRVPVDGMSDGTCDQLYLALRLATLESRLEVSEPMPLIVDDILINFDDKRSRATLAILAELSMKNQVILFTHHSQVVDEAGKLPAEADIVVHEL